MASDDRSDRKRTWVGHAGSESPPRLDEKAAEGGMPKAVPDDPPEAALAAPVVHAHTASAHTPLVEIEVVHEFGPAPGVERPWKTVEVWTRNRVYVLDPSLVCAEVRELASQKPAPDHAFLGSRLVGGQQRREDTIEMSYPFPRPGTEAVFEKIKGNAVRFFRTSPVTRVILRLHILTVAPSSVVPTWAEITGVGRE